MGAVFSVSRTCTSTTRKLLSSSQPTINHGTGTGSSRQSVASSPSKPRCKYSLQLFSPIIIISTSCLFVCLLVYLFVCFFIWLFAFLFVYFLACLFICLFACLLACVRACLFICLLVCLFIRLLVYLFACLFFVYLLACLFACLFICSLVYLLAYLFVYLFWSVSKVTSRQDMADIQAPIWAVVQVRTLAWCNCINQVT